MHYILMDLEWNQPLSHLSAQYRRYGKQLMFDMIQIGAVKLDEGKRMLGSFNQFIQPGLYRKLHPRISRITGITQEDLYGAPGFTEALARFVAWCGEDYALITWGCDDISVFQQNLNFYLEEERAMPPVYDLQRLYSAQDKQKNRAGLASAMKAMGISPSDEHPFHSAVDDAYYTAMIMQRLPEAEKVLEHPQAVRELVPATNKGREEKADDLRFTSLKQALDSKPAQEPNCPVCGRRLSIPEGYAPFREQTWRALADCPDHGLVLVDLVLDKTSDGKPRVRRRAALSEQQNPAYVKTKHLQWAGKVSKAKLKEDIA